MKKEKIIVLGGGLVGGPMALDLAVDERFAVTVADVNEVALEELRAKQPKLTVIREDLSSPSKVTELVAGYDIVLNMLDRYDPHTGTLSMARTTGYTATAAVRMLIEGLYKEPGIAPPELIGRHKEPFDFMNRCLRERQVVCEEEVIGGSPILC